MTRVGTAPTAVAVGYGAVWVANNTDGTLTRLSATTGRRTGPAIPVGAGPLAVAVGERGVWVATGDGAVRRVDPHTRRISPPARVAGVAGLAVGSGGVWAASASSGNLVRLDPRTGRQQGRPIPVGRSLSDVTVGGGFVWVADTARGDIARVDPRTNRVTGRTKVTHRQPNGQVLGLTFGQGHAWVATTSQRLADSVDLVRLDASSGAVAGKPLRVSGRVGLDLTTGGGSVWATDPGNTLPAGRRRRPALQRIDADRYALAGRPIRVGLDPAAVAFGHDTVWVANSGANTITSIRP